LVDEASMVDTLLLARLLQALPDDCQVVLIGDVNQLESVAPGQVLYDILQTDVAKKVYLEKIYRHDNSFLFDVAYAMNQGIYDPALFVGDVQMVACDTHSVSQQIQRLTKELMQQGTRMDDIQLLAPMYKGVVGIDALNADLQEVLNPTGPAVTFMGQQFREGDKVLQLVNQPIDGVMNGEVGRIIEASKDVKVDFEGVIVSYGRSDLMQLKHAYCMSIHKSQGNEYDVVIIALSMSYKTMLQRKLLYTAATRAKKQLIFVGDPSAFQYAITTQVEPRKTTLQQRLQSE
jgi:exodeoxyribonuclease V alpha subunit